MAAAIPALIALGYSFACEAFHEPSDFVVQLSIMLIGLIQRPYLLVVTLLVSAWHPRTCNAGGDVLAHLVMLAAVEVAL